MSWLSDASGINLDIPNKNTSIDPGKAALTVLNPALAGNIAGINALLPGGKGPDKPGMMPGLDEAQQRMMDQANSFTKNLPQSQAQFEGQAESASRRALAEKQAGVSKQYSRRGLLGSGIEAKAQGQAAGEEAANLAEKKRQIRMGLYEQANTLQDRAIKAGISNQQLAQTQEDMAAQAYQDVINSRLSGISSISSGIGKAVAMGKGA